MRGFEGAESVQIAGDEAVLYIRDASSVVAQLVRAMDDAGLTIAQLRLTHPTLDDVFLRATGHHLEAEERAAAEREADKR